MWASTWLKWTRLYSYCMQCCQALTSNQWPCDFVDIVVINGHNYFLRPGFEVSNPYIIFNLFPASYDL